MSLSRRIHADVQRPIHGKRFGAFELLERLGRGGMATVYKARHPNFPEPVALKVANMVVAGDFDLSKRFENEYRVGKQLEHPNLVKTLANGVERDVPYLVMEYVPGANLDKYILQNGVLSEAKALMIFSQIVNAVQYIHERGLVHRDIKPANILIDPSGCAKLADLGLIKDSDAQVPLTHSRVSLGTPDYAAPEQFEDAASADRHCDIFSLGVSLYVALTGIFPFGRAGQVAILIRKAKFEFAPLSRVLLHVDDAIDRAVTRAMHPNPQIRHPSARDFLNEIRDKATEPGPALTPLCPASYRPESINRRKETRLHVTISSIKVALHRSDMPSIYGDTINISPNGLCLKASRAFSVGSMLMLTFPASSGKTPIRARVCWVRQAPERLWLMGCAFSTELGQNDLEELMDPQLSDTSVVPVTKMK